MTQFNLPFDRYEDPTVELDFDSEPDFDWTEELTVDGVLMLDDGAYEQWAEY